MQCPMGPEFKALASEISDVKDRIAEIKAETTRTATLVEAFVSRAADEREALFRARSKHEERLSAIERDYVPRTRHEQDVQEIKSEAGKTGDRVGALERQAAKVAGWAAAASFVASGIFTLVSRYLWH